MTKDLDAHLEIIIIKKKNYDSLRLHSLPFLNYFCHTSIDKRDDSEVTSDKSLNVWIGKC